MKLDTTERFEMLHLSHVLLQGRNPVWGHVWIFETGGG